MKNLFIIAVALFNIYNNMMVVKNLTGFVVASRALSREYLSLP